MDGVTTGGCKRIWRLGGSVRMREECGGERHGDSDSSHLLATAEAATNISIIKKNIYPLTPNIILSVSDDLRVNLIVEL